MAKNGQKCSIIAKNDIKRSKMARNIKKSKNDQKGPKNGQQWWKKQPKYQKITKIPKMTKNGQKWSKMA